MHMYCIFNGCAKQNLQYNRYSSMYFFSKKHSVRKYKIVKSDECDNFSRTIFSRAGDRPERKMSSYAASQEYVEVYNVVQSRPICQGIQFRSFYKAHNRKYRTNKTLYKLYRCMPAGSTRHYTLLHTPTMPHTKTFFAPACHPREKILSEKNCRIRHFLLFCIFGLNVFSKKVHR